MSSREKILKQIAQNKPAVVPMPPSFVADHSGENSLEKYQELLHSIGGRSLLVNSLEDVQIFLQQKIAKGKVTVNCISEISPFHGHDFSNSEARELEGVHTVLLRGKLAVAENAAIWVSERAMINRSLPFICQELVMVIHQKDIVADMHQAYEKTSIDEDGYGVFIAGPSKTADIEQSLVIGAHGPLSLQVFILKEEPQL